MKIRSALISITTVFATLMALPAPAATADPSRSLSVELGHGVEVLTTVDLEQTDVRDFALPYLRQVRADMYDKNVPFRDQYDSTYSGPLREVVAAYGLTRDQYVNGLQWSDDLELIAVQRAVEEKYSESLDHDRPNGTSSWTAVLPNGSKSWGENICGWARADLEHCLQAWTYDEESDLRKANGGFNYNSGHLYNVINSSRTYVAVGGAGAFFSSQHSMYPSLSPTGTRLEGLTVLSITAPEKDIRSDFSLNPFSDPISPGTSTAVTMRNHNGFDLPGTIETTDTNVISIIGDTVTALDYGTATITFHSDDGQFTESTTITVTDPSPSSLSSSSSGSSKPSSLLAVIAAILAAVGIGAGFIGLNTLPGVPF